LEVLGRRDDQLKVRGYRVNPGEIELALLEDPDIREAAVVGHEGADGAVRLVAYLVANGAPPARGALRSALRERLPDYMIPSAFSFLDELPVGPSGKIDRRALSPLAPKALDGPRPAAGTPGLLGTQLCAVWEELLGVTGVGAGDDFLELGGDSLLAVEMLGRVEAVCGRAIPPSRLVDGPLTIERLARILLDDARAGWVVPVARVQAGGSRRPLFFVHGDVEHGGFYCHGLARRLGPEQPFYSVAPHGLDGGELPWSIEAMAAERLADIRAIQPQGPYRLGGFCLGGVIAFEMARQLERAGEGVDALLLVDSRALNGPLGYRFLGRATRWVARANRWSEARRRAFYLRLRIFVEAWRESGRPEGRGRARFILHKLRRPSRRGIRREGPDAEAEEISAGPSLRPAYAERLRDYVPGRYGGAVALFSSERLPDKPPGGPMAGWDRLAAVVEVHPVPGHHHLAVTRYVDVLADKMKAYLG
ncbi:MAG TPA: thioesterase domain-containing protein, partial [Candidatus Methylomirabilis sp.]|nr:thioesterase domain-containing protein [Candidatus Methylomirabilis sp.]